jgi:hypothetical protein
MVLHIESFHDARLARLEAHVARGATWRRRESVRSTHAIPNPSMLLQLGELKVAGQELSIWHRPGFRHFREN